MIRLLKYVHGFNDRRQTAVLFASAGTQACPVAGLAMVNRFYGRIPSGAEDAAPIVVGINRSKADHEIMSWGGWKTLREVQRYTATANRLADQAMARRKESAVRM